MKSSKIKVEKFRRGRNRGAVYTVSSGERCYLAHTKLTYIFCSGEKTISDAVRKGTACWSFDEEVLMNMRAKGIRFIGVLCQENSDIFLAHTEAFFDRTRTVRHIKANPNRRYLPLTEFRRRPGRVRLK